MRPRHLLALLAVAAIPVGLAVALSAGDSGSSASSSTGVQVSLHLEAGASVGGVRACGIVHHYKAYGSGSTITFRGGVSPAATAGVKVKVKLKVCTAGIFQPSGDVIARVHGSGAYKGSFPAPTAGDYFARAEVTRAGVRLARSEKRYFEVR
jgi:hypothetical protein